MSPCISTVITNSSRQNNYIHDLTCTRSAAQNLRYFSQQTTNTTFIMVQHNSRFCYNFSPHPLLFSNCKSSIVPSRRIESMIDHLPLLACLLACLPIQTHWKSNISVRYKMDAREHNTSYKAKRRTPLTFCSWN